GNNRYPIDQAEALARQVFGSNVMEGHLGEVRQRLMREPLIKDAIVARLLPNALRIRLIEREPVAVVALSSGRLVCVDAEGVVLGNFELLGDQPPLLGWDERASALSRSRNRQRLRLYLELKRALTATGRDDWDQVDQVDIHDLSDVAVSLTRSPTTWIHLGDGDFGPRFALGLDVLDAIRHRNRQQLRRLGIPLNDEMLVAGVDITYIDVSHPSRVVVRLPGAKLRSQIRRRKHRG
ncbi:MAG: FtsQ-type POTRA domain-containing protein, partial [Acidobacteria bacterium]